MSWGYGSAKKQQQHSTEHSVGETKFRNNIGNIMLLVGQESKERQEKRLTTVYTCHMVTPPV